MADNTNDPLGMQEEAARLIKEREAAKKAAIEEEELLKNSKTITHLKSSHDAHSNFEKSSVIEDIGWIRVKLETLPSQGIFYPQGTEITIRAAAVAEIRQWSTIDEEDLLAIDDALNRIIDKCCRIKFPGMMGSYKDIKELDRFFIVFAIREYTFKRGENQLSVTFDCKCGKNEPLAITKEMLSYYVPSTELQTRFSDDERCFILNLKNGEEIKLYLPTLGVMSYIKGYIREKSQSRQDYDKPFLRWAPFIFPDWRALNEAMYQRSLQDSYTWSISKISVIDWFVDQMQKTVNSDLKHKCASCGSEVTASLSFRGGIKSLFLISGIPTELI